MTYLQRYLAGEHEHVWAQLYQLGDRVRQDPLLNEARDVARATMDRARHNIELLVQRLEAIEYHFGPNWWEFEDDVKPDEEELFARVFAKPKPNVHDQITELESIVGPLPLSLVAWYEHVGSVTLAGSFPPEPSYSATLTTWRQWRQAHAGMERYATLDTALEMDFEHDLDPLYVEPIEAALRRFRRWGRDGRTDFIDIGPDEYFKQGIAGGGFYQIRVPNASIDAPLEYEWHQTTFVNYLRMCFHWGGFPGLESRSDVSSELLTYLTEGLLPI